MEKQMWRWKLLFLLFLSLLYVAFSEDFPSQGCYWTETCLHKLHGDCGGLVYNQSSNCYGNCQGLKYSSCPPNHTHFYCCIAGSPTKVKDGCKKCENKVEDDDGFVCCGDCTYPDMVYGDTSLGYCKSGSELISQPKPKEVFKWVNGPWLPCSALCGGGIRSRRVDCYAVIEETSFPDYPVYDDHCLNQEKPKVRELCNLQNCVASVVSNGKDKGRRHSRTLTWMMILLIFVAIIALGFAGFIFYTRRTSNESGYVYIMMEGFS
ncbi:uncharacterized protein [Spinacia oleracea]|uniref:Uncharacterized protein n=1 Tax=Spinacia oleracea TaxID=3562 RepID=A0A9R0IF67_SPIOL|nr:uncharacterized protein LOC110787858 [Spinacia oleracea]